MAEQNDTHKDPQDASEINLDMRNEGIVIEHAKTNEKEGANVDIGSLEQDLMDAAGVEVTPGRREEEEEAG